ncbi:hypothetical protein QQS21_010525 [Conoideocrella luteorostrata]|uniref:Mid2 domain-containing protein n=1 Tax=Conoideocrella luteorostrata TaxID=1105319 RepID=A0AAJ0CEZ3_9HYPO|nr:hypothetical protein QQS21_010525 [Conoideocrella luteorostrata]
MGYPVETQRVEDGPGYSKLDAHPNFQGQTPWPSASVDDTPKTKLAEPGTGPNTSSSSSPVVFGYPLNSIESKDRFLRLDQHVTLSWAALNVTISSVEWMSRTDLYSREDITLDTIPRANTLVISDLLSNFYQNNTANNSIALNTMAWSQRNTPSVRRINFMTLKVNWTDKDNKMSGTFSSGVFTVNLENSPALHDEWPDIYVEWSRQFNQSDNQQKFGTNTISPETSSPLGTGSSPPSQAESDSGLSTGAIAGIAVGCGIALILLVTALVWFLLVRRRRQNKQPYDAQDKTAAYAMEDKNAATAHIADSPQSQYPEDDVHNQLGAHNVHPAAVPLHSSHDEHHRNDPSADLHATAISHDVDEREPERGESSRAASRGANFVEQGMTEDERQRWEEEERHLDDEIARKRGP